MWVDLAREDAATLERVAEWLELEPDTVEGLATPSSRPWVEQFEGYTHLVILAVQPPATPPRARPDQRDEGGDEEEGAGDAFEPIAVDCLVGPNWILTVHHPSLDVVEWFTGPIKTDTNLGTLDGPAFLASLIDVLLSGYFRVVEGMTADVDALDERLLSEDVDEEDLLRELVEVRRRITILRATLVPHRDLLPRLVHSQFARWSETASDDRYRHIAERVERAIDAVEHAREMLMGSFEVFMTQTAHRTNEVMKVLTVVSVVLLPSTLVAGIMSLSVRASLYRSPVMFWITLGVMACLVAGGLLVARRRRWL